MSLLAAPLLAVALHGAPPARLDRRVGAMGTELTIRVEAGSRAEALAASERAVAALTAVEERLSTWRPDSELARLNRSPAGRPVALSAATLADLGAAAACWRDTGGAFDAGIGALVDAWGLRDGGRVPNEDELGGALAASGFALLELHADTGVAVRRHPDLRIEEGGFGKGAGLAAAARVLAEDPAVHRASLDFGGQLALVGGGPWSVQVAHPRQRRHSLLTLTVGGGSLATSGSSERGIEVGGRRYGHLLDPAAGRPVDDFGSLTVWSPDPLRADCLSTALYVMGPRAALEWAAATPDVEVLVVEAGGEALRVRATPGLARGAEVVEPGLSIEIFHPNRPGTRPDQKPRTTVAMPWEGRTVARETPAPPHDGTGIQEEYR